MRQKINIIIRLFILFGLFGNCSRPYEDDNSLILGKWVPIANSVDAIVYTSKNEIYPHFDLPANGSISVSGDISGTISYLDPPSNSNQTRDLYSHQNLLPDSYPYLWLRYENFFTPLLELIYKIDDTSSVHYITNLEDSNYSFVDFSFACDSIKLFLHLGGQGDVDSSRSIIIDGELSNQITEIPAYTSVLVHTMEGSGEGLLFDLTMTFNEPNEWKGEFFNSQMFGEWELNESRITIIYEKPAGSETYLDTIVREYEIGDDLLTLTNKDTLGAWDGPPNHYYDWYKQTSSVLSYIRIGRSLFEHY